MKLIVIGKILLITLFASAPMYGKDEGKTLDSGSFGVFINGKRVATESFSVQQQASGVSTATSQLKEEGGAASQSSELQINSNGSLVKYEWRELSPGKSQLSVLPNNEFLVEKISQSPGEKPAEQPFLMPNTSVVLDNNFFLHRELLAWKYLASSCEQKQQIRCAAAQFGAIIPQERASVRVSIQPSGEEKISIRGGDRTLVRLNVKSDEDQWTFWVDPADHFKLIKVTKAGDTTEIIRD